MEAKANNLDQLSTVSSHPYQAIQHSSCKKYDITSSFLLTATLSNRCSGVIILLEYLWRGRCVVMFWNAWGIGIARVSPTTPTSQLAQVRWLGNRSCITRCWRGERSCITRPLTSAPRCTPMFSQPRYWSVFHRVTLSEEQVCESLLTPALSFHATRLTTFNPTLSFKFSINYPQQSRKSLNESPKSRADNYSAISLMNFPDGICPVTDGVYQLSALCELLGLWFCFPAQVSSWNMLPIWEQKVPRNVM